MRLVSIALALAAAACSRGPGSAPANAAAAPPEEAAPSTSEAAQPAVDPLAGRLWALSPGDGRPGVFRIFFSSGAMMQGSCVETYRVSPWRRDGAGRVLWNEDGKDIVADVVAVNGDSLTLSLDLAGERKVETYTAASTPFVCPDLPR